MYTYVYICFLNLFFYLFLNIFFAPFFNNCPKFAVPDKHFNKLFPEVASPSAVIQNAKVAGIPYRFGRHQTKIGPNPNVLAYSKRS